MFSSLGKDDDDDILKNVKVEDKKGNEGDEEEKPEKIIENKEKPEKRKEEPKKVKSYQMENKFWRGKEQCNHCGLALEKFPGEPIIDHPHYNGLWGWQVRFCKDECKVNFHKQYSQYWNTLCREKEESYQKRVQEAKEKGLPPPPKPGRF